MGNIVFQKYLAYLIILISFILTLFVTYLDINTTFSLSGISEIVTIDTTETNNFKLNNVELKNKNKIIKVNGKLTVNPHVRIKFIRIGYGPLYISLEPIAKGNKNNLLLGLLSCEKTNETYQLIDYARVRIKSITESEKKGRTITIPIKGSIIIGGRLLNRATSSYPLLHSLNIRMIGISLITNRLYESGEAVLDFGDYFYFDPLDSVAIGVIRIGSRDGMQLVFRAISKVGIVERAGSSGYKISSSIYDRILNDHMIQSVWVAFIFIAKIIIDLSKKRRILRKIKIKHIST